MPDNGHYYVVLTVHFFKDSTCDWTGIVHDSFMLHSWFLNEPFKPFQTLSLLEIMYESDEETGSFDNDQPELNFLVGLGRTNLYSAGILDHNNSNCLKQTHCSVHSEGESPLIVKTHLIP